MESLLSLLLKFGRVRHPKYFTVVWGSVSNPLERGMASAQFLARRPNPSAARQRKCLGRAQNIAPHHPALVADARSAPEQVRGIELALDGVEAWIIAAPEGVLEVWLVHIGLDTRSARAGGIS